MSNQIISQTVYKQIQEKIKFYSSPWESCHFWHETCKALYYPDETEPYIHIHPFSHQYITKQLNKFRVAEYRSDTPVFIDAQTGAGKSSFIFGTLYPLLHDRGQKLLFLSSRSALKYKQKKEALNIALPDLKNCYTNDGFELLHNFNDIDIFSYQDMSICKYREEIANTAYGAVVFDEVHFFVSDATFNASTNFIFDFLKTVTRDSLRFYLSATPDEIFDTVYNIEETHAIPYGLTQHALPSGMEYYHFDRDYTYIRPVFFSMENNNKQLVKIIEQSSMKWLVFVRSISMGINLKKQLSSSKRVVFLDKDSKNNTEKKFYESLIETESLGDVGVLIATKCLDVGINIKDSPINIVNFFFDKTDFIQSIGRKRILHKNDLVQLYLPLYGKDHIQKEYEKVAHSFTVAQKLCKQLKGKEVCGSDVPFPLYAVNGTYTVNKFYFIKIQHTMQCYENILSIIPTEAAKEEETNIISASILSWINSDYTAQPTEKQPSNDNSLYAPILSVVEPWLNSEYCKKELDSLLLKMRPLLHEIDHTVRIDKGLGIPTANKFLSKLDMEIVNTDTKKAPAIYRIIQHNIPFSQEGQYE